MADLPEYVRQLGVSSIPTIQVSNAQSQLIGGISKELQSVGNAMHQKDMEIATIRANTELQTTLAKQYDEFGHDPGALKKAQDEFRKGFINNLPSELQAKADATWDSYTQPYISKATNTYQKNQDEALKLAYYEAYNSGVNTVKVAVGSIDSNIPEQQTGAYRSIGASGSVLEAMKNAKDRHGGMLFSPEQISSLEQQAFKKAQSAAEAARKAPIDQAITADTNGFIMNPDGYGIRWKDADEKRKAINEAISIRDQQQKISDITQIITGEKSNEDLVSMVDSGSPDAFAAIEEARNDGIDPIFLDHLSDRMKKINPVSQDKKDEIYSSIFDKVNELTDDTSIEDVVRLKKEITTAAAMGISVGKFQTSVGKVMVKKAQNETGVNDPGWGWWGGANDPSEEYDIGYQAIQSHLDTHDIKNVSVKSRLIQKYVQKMDDAPADIKADDALYKAYQNRAAIGILAQNLADVVKSKGGTFIPLPGIKKLMANKGLRTAFDEQFGAGSAAKVLGE